MIAPVDSSGIVDDKVVTDLMRAERIDLKDEFGEELDNTTEEQTRGDKAYLTQIQKSMKDFLCKVFVPMNT